MLNSPVDERAVVRLGSRVRFRDQHGEIEFEIVAPDDVDFHERRMSAESPLGTALLGRSAGEVVLVQTPDGRHTVLIVGVQEAPE